MEPVSTVMVHDVAVGSVHPRKATDRSVGNDEVDAPTGSRHVRPLVTELHCCEDRVLRKTAVGGNAAQGLVAVDKTDLNRLDPRNPFGELKQKRPPPCG